MRATLCSGACCVLLPHGTEAHATDKYAAGAAPAPRAPGHGPAVPSGRGGAAAPVPPWAPVEGPALRPPVPLPLRGARPRAHGGAPERRPRPPAHRRRAVPAPRVPRVVPRGPVPLRPAALPPRSGCAGAAPSRCRLRPPVRRCGQRPLRTCRALWQAPCPESEALSDALPPRPIILTTSEREPASGGLMSLGRFFCPGTPPPPCVCLCSHGPDPSQGGRDQNFEPRTMPMAKRTHKELRWR